jgi:predicted molibdopterin-dependent oxidoreductase YjgC
MITINGKQVAFEEGQTVLDAATNAGIIIPTLCTHSELEPFGACRLCIVKVEGLRGFPTSCTTLVKDGMVITTEDDELLRLRKNVLEMLLLEHPNSCIICNDREECEECHIAPSKAGRVTGCRFCPNKTNCEVRDISDSLGLKDLRLPFMYKGLPMERDDPFFDRDYNLCILCGRCVRVCQDIRGAGTLAFTQRSSRTKVGTAFDKLHMDSNCGFCGACVDVCPTGSLSARGSKWYGDADECTESVCMLCSVGCGFSFESKWNRVMGAIPIEDGHTKGQACSRGRFCIPALLNGPDRLKQPMVRINERLVPMSWEDAIAHVADKLGEYEPEEIGIIASSFLTNESAYILQKFARAVLGTNNIGLANGGFVTRILNTIGAGGYAHSGNGKIGIIEKSKWIVILGNRLLLPPNALIPSIYRAKKKGAKVVLIDFDKNAKAPLKIIDLHYTLRPSETLNLLYGIIHRLFKSNPDVAKGHENHEAFAESIKSMAVENLEGVSDKVEELSRIIGGGEGSIIFGEDALYISEPEEILKAIMNTLTLAGSPKGFVPYYEEGNANGVCDMGALGQYLPGHAPVVRSENVDRFSEFWDVDLPDEKGKGIEQILNGGVKALYLTEPADIENIDKVDFLVLQDIYPSKIMEKADVVLPACAFTEESGTVTSFERRLLSVNRAVRTQASAWPDWRIICELAGEMGAKGFDHETSSDILEEIREFVPLKVENGFVTSGNRAPGLLPFVMKQAEDMPQPGPRFRYRGADIIKRVEDFRIQMQGGGQ